MPRHIRYYTTAKKGRWTKPVHEASRRGAMVTLDELFAALDSSPFRKRVALNEPEARYLATKTLPIVLDHARDFIRERLAPALPANDGQQTPMRGHPAFVAQHATATCCRRCLLRWHQIQQGRSLTADEIDHIVTALERWLSEQKLPAKLDKQKRLF